MKTRIILSATFAATVSLAMGGCFNFPLDHSTSRPGDTYSPPSTSSGTPIHQTGNAEMLQGSMGNVTSFSSMSPELSITGSSTYASVRIDAINTTERWWAMNNLTITGGLNNPSLQPGAHLSFTSASSYGNGLRVTALGCSGPSRGNYTYDHPATRVDVDVMPGNDADHNRMVFTAYYTATNGTQQNVQGSFEYQPR